MPDSQFPIVVIDPGHGGRAFAGRSSPQGIRGPRGTLEKDVTLRLARAVARHLGGRVRLTREADLNLSLGDRIERARRAGAGVFVSIHCGAPDRIARSYTHVHGSSRSRALAESIAERLRGAGGRGGLVGAGDLAVLAPDRHRDHTAAVLLEVDDISDEDGELRLSDPDEIEAVGQSIAAGIRSFRTARAPRPGARAQSTDAAGDLAPELDASPTPSSTPSGGIGPANAELGASIESELRSLLDADRLIDAMIQSVTDLEFPDPGSPATVGNDASSASSNGTLRYGDPNDPPPARAATPGDLARALFAYPPISQGLHLLGDDAVAKFRLLSPADKVALLTTTIPIAAGLVYGVVRDRSLWAPGQTLLNGAFNAAIHPIVPDLNVNLDIVSPNHSLMVTFDLAPTLRRAGLPF
jgi:hypothetical protein